MVGVLAGWLLRKWWERRNAPPPPEPEPDPNGIYEGTVTLSSVVAGPVRRECKISEPLDEDGTRVLLEEGEKLVETTQWATSMKSREDGRITIRFEGDSGARDEMMRAGVGDEYRLEFYLLKKEKPPVRPAPWEGGHRPFGDDAGGGMFS